VDEEEKCLLKRKGEGGRPTRSVVTATGLLERMGQRSRAKVPRPLAALPPYLALRPNV